MVNHHPSDELLMEFAAGQIPNALGVMVACHLQHCSYCRQRTRLFERIGGEILQSASRESMDSSLLEQTLARLDEPEPAQVAPYYNKSIPKPLKRFVPADFDQLPWTGLSRTVREFKLACSDDDFTAKLYRIAAGKELPEHGHKGGEFTLVMQGQFSDRAGDYAEGDFIHTDNHTIHQPKASTEQDCICFVVMDGPIKMTGLFNRLLNPFLS
jgi:putative transcriptional regulator